MANNQVDLKLPKGGLFLVIIVIAGIILLSKSTVTIKSGQA